MNSEEAVESRAKRDAQTGRPRDPSVEGRCIEATLSIYNAQGLRGLNFDAVARTASVGKAALYSRWASIEDLLIAALETVSTSKVDVDTGTVRGDLEQWGRLLWHDYSVPGGMISVRVNLDAAQTQALSKPYGAFLTSYRATGTLIVERAKARGELPADLDTFTVLDLMVGGVLAHILFTPPEKRRLGPAEEAIIDGLVTAILDGVLVRR